MVPRPILAIPILMFLVSMFLAMNAHAQGRSVTSNEFMTRGQTHAGITNFTVDSAAMIRILAAGGHLQISDFPGGGAELVSLDLKPAHSPIDATTQFVEGSLSGDRIIPTPSFSVYRGVVSGEPHSKVTLTVFSGKLLCSIQRESGDQFVIGPAKNDSSGARHIFLRENDLLSVTPFRPFDCLTENMEQPAPKSGQGTPSMNGVSSITNALATTTLLQTDIAVEADTCFFKAAGGNLATVNGYIASLFAMCSAIYEDEANVMFHLTSVRVWTNTDPYGVNGNAYAMDAIVRPYWRAHYANVPRDLAHIMTSVGYGGGGFGWFSLCDTTQSYSYSSPQTGHAYPTFAFTYDVSIISHEIGHNFSLRHGHDCWWAPPLDTCWTTDDTITRRDGSGNKLGQLVQGDACCSLPITPRPSPGTLMSYCPNANYILANADFSKYKIEMTFSKRGGDSIRKFAGLAPCIEPPTHPIVILTNPRGSMSYPGDTTLTISWSTANLNAVSLEYSANAGSTWSRIADSVVASTGSLGWKVPNFSSQKMLVRVFDVSSDTVADTSLLFFTVTKTAAAVDGSPGTSRGAIAFSIVSEVGGAGIRIVPSSPIVNLKSEILDERGIVVQVVNGNADVSSGLAVGLRTLPVGTYFLHIASPVDRVIAFTHYQ